VIFSSVVGQRKGPSGANAPPVHGIKKCLELLYMLQAGFNQQQVVVVNSTTTQYNIAINR
jgi:hypothetical protein